jgi:hypothetical protein
VIDARRTLLTRHFRLFEFDSRDGARVPGAYEDDVRNWCRWVGEPLRARFGAVHILSGYRSDARNAAVGGASRSVHLLRTALPDRAGSSSAVAVAADVTCAKGSPASWAAWFLEHRQAHEHLGRRGRGGLGHYPGFVHLDTGPARSW